MSDVNPPPLRVPRSLAIDKEAFNYFLQLHRFLMQMWTEVGGGSPGTVAAADDDIFELPRTVDTQPLERLIHATDTISRINALAEELRALERRLESIDVQHKDPKVDELEMLAYGSEL